MDARELLQLLETGLAAHNAGRHTDADAVYRRVLSIDPDNSDALHLLGVLECHRARPEAGLPLLQRAVHVAPGIAQFQLHLGQALLALRRFNEALGVLALAIQLDPQDASARSEAGTALSELGRRTEALEQFRIAVELDRRNPLLLGNYGMTLSRIGRSAEAIAALNRAVEMDPGQPQLLTQLAQVLWAAQKYEQSLPLARRVTEMTPDDASAWVLLGNSCQTTARFDEAADAYRKALALNPKSFDALNNLALTLLKMGRAVESLELYDQAVERWPEAHDSLANRSLARLTLGDFARGFAEYETRWLGESFKGKAPSNRPRWDGADPSGKTVLLTSEQGMGDVIHFIRYASQVAERGARVRVACPVELGSLVATVVGVESVHRIDLELPPFDLYAPLASLPAIFRTTLETIPSHVPYVRADAERVSRWRNRLSGDGGLKVGLAWAGAAAHLNDYARSIRLEMLGPLAGVEGASFYSLQKGPPAEQVARPPAGMRITPLGDELHDYGDTAAVLECLDLVISVDTSVVHLAGALARPVWTLLSAGPDWRWMLDRDDSPWYPTMRLFRQRSPGDWTPVIERVAQELSIRVKEAR